VDLCNICNEWYRLVPNSTLLNLHGQKMFYDNRLETSTLRSFIGQNLPLLKDARLIVDNNPPSKISSHSQQLSEADITGYNILHNSTVCLDYSGKLKWAVIFLDKHTLSAEQREAIMSLLAKLPKYHRPVTRSKKKHESGKAYGLYWRKAYLPADIEPVGGPYMAKENWRNTLEYDMFCSEVAEKVILPVDTIAKTFFKSYQERIFAKQLSKVPQLDHNLDKSSVTTMYCSHQYGVAMHRDNDSGMAFGLWLLQHTRQCKTNSRKCLRGWYFVFWESKVAVYLQDCTFIAWDTKYLHGTIPGQASNSQCSAEQWAVAMQNQGKFIRACDKHN